jgi:hypothetical protein
MTILALPLGLNEIYCLLPIGIPPILESRLGEFSLASAPALEYLAGLILYFNYIIMSSRYHLARDTRLAAHQHPADVVNPAGRMPIFLER